MRYSFLGERSTGHTTLKVKIFSLISLLDRTIMLCYGSTLARAGFLCGLLTRNTWFVHRFEVSRTNLLTLDQQRQFEAVARNEYTKDENRSPVNCSLFYVALRKKAVLQGLWRMAGGDKEQITTQRFLAHDFEDPRWRTAALKNAYALLSKRRFSTLNSLKPYYSIMTFSSNLCNYRIRSSFLFIS
jgi:hypothetical protein